MANVGKSTLFNALTNAGALAANYPFATIEPNVGMVAVPDERLGALARIYNSKKIVPAMIEFVDIAGLIKGAAQGEGLGNKFLANIRECRVICHVVRAFNDKNIVSVNEGGNDDRIKQIKSDWEVVRTELALKDIETLEKVLGKVQKEAKSGDKQAIKKQNAITEALKKLKSGETELEVKEDLGVWELLTTKPEIIMFNVDEEIMENANLVAKIKAAVVPREAVIVNAKLEAEMADMTTVEKHAFLESYGIKEDGLAQLVKAAYKTLGLISFLTAGEKETRAWTIRQGALAPEAAGTIHSDFEHGFIAASVCNYKDLVRLKSEKAVKEAGLMRMEGKDYLMQDGDVVEFRFNN